MRIIINNVRKYYAIAECLSRNENIGHSETIEREMLVNVNCPIRMILDYIRKVAHINNTCKCK